MIKAVLFDLDGLLVDSEICFYNSYVAFLQQYNKSFSLEEYMAKYCGSTLLHNCIDIKEKYGLDFSFEEFNFFFLERENKEIELGNLCLKKGALELLNYLKKNNYKIALATSSIADRAIRIIDKNNVKQYFDVFVYGPEVKHAKPAPDVFLKCCEKLQVNPENSLVLEDSELGVEAGYKAGCRVINIPDLKDIGDEYKKMSDKQYESLFEVIDYLENEKKNSQTKK